PTSPDHHLRVSRVLLCQSFHNNALLVVQIERLYAIPRIARPADTPHRGQDVIRHRRQIHVHHHALLPCRRRRRTRPRGTHHRGPLQTRRHRGPTRQAKTHTDRGCVRAVVDPTHGDGDPHPARPRGPKLHRRELGRGEIHPIPRRGGGRFCRHLRDRRGMERGRDAVRGGQLHHPASGGVGVPIHQLTLKIVLPGGVVDHRGRTPG